MNYIKDEWKKVNVSTTTRRRDGISLEFTQENGDRIVYCLSRRTAKWLSKALKNAVKLNTE